VKRYEQSMDTMCVGLNVDRTTTSHRILVNSSTRSQTRSMVCPDVHSLQSPGLTVSAVVYGVYGLRRVQSQKDGGLWSTLAFPYWGLIGVGLLSMWFHATLKYHSQMGKLTSLLTASSMQLNMSNCQATI
jgi:hypothetical protein